MCERGGRMSRRSACAIIGSAAAGALLVLATACRGGRLSTDNAPPVVPPATDVAEPGLTVGTTEGPYYVTDTAELKDGNLNYTDLPGEPIMISGFVYDGPGTSTPVSGAKIEIWHADTSGNYRPNSNGSATQYSASELGLRGYVLTDANGRYEFTSIYPGYYPGRTRHIHVRATAEGIGGVITQIIVPPKSGDGTTPETDGIAQSLPQDNFVTFTDDGGVGVTSFDFHIAGD